MKMEELKGKTVDQLKELVVGMKKELFNFRFQKATGELENTSRIKLIRRDIARIYTLLNQMKKAGE